MNEKEYLERVATLPGPDANAIEAATIRQQQLTKPAGSLGKLEDVAIWMAGWQATEKPRLNAPSCLIFAGNHGVTAQGVSAFPAEVTAQMVANFTHGGAAINQLCRAAGAELIVEAIDLDHPTADFTQGPAMSTEEALAAMAIGAARIPDNTDLILVGEMGIGNTTAAAAIAHAVFDGSVESWVGRGTGVDEKGLKRKADAIQRGRKPTRTSSTTGWAFFAPSVAVKWRPLPVSFWKLVIVISLCCLTVLSRQHLPCPFMLITGPHLITA